MGIPICFLTMASTRLNKKAIPGLLIVAWLIYVVIRVNLVGYQLEKKGYYTIGTTKGYFTLYRSRKIQVQYVIAGKEYNTYLSNPGNIKIDEGKYIVVFLPGKPYTSRVDFTIEYPDSLPPPPPEGWERYPLRKYGYRFEY